MLATPYSVAVVCAVVAIIGLAYGDWLLSFVTSAVGVTAYWLSEWFRRGGGP